MDYGYKFNHKCECDLQIPSSLEPRQKNVHNRPKKLQDKDEMK